MSRVMPLTAENLQAHVEPEDHILKLKSVLKTYYAELYQFPIGGDIMLASKRELQAKIGKVIDELEVIKQKPSYQFSDISIGTLEMLAESIKRKADQDWPNPPAKYLKLDMSGTKGEVDYEALIETIEQLSPSLPPTLSYDLSPMDELSPNNMRNPDEESTEEDES
jgi:hypothetical protein